MLIQMDERKIKTIEDITLFLAGADSAELRIQGSKDDIYSWVERTLNRLRYSKLSKKEKGLVLRYLIQLSGYSRQQVTRFITQYRETGHVRRRQRTVNGFERKYTREDIMLLAEVDRLVDSTSGTTVKVYCQRAYERFGDQRYVRLANISVSHLYNLRGSKVYRRCRRVYTKTNPVQVPIGERCKPRPDGPGTCALIVCIRVIWTRKKACITSILLIRQRTAKCRAVSQAKHLFPVARCIG
jgi:hypothetical protein